MKKGRTQHRFERLRSTSLSGDLKPAGQVGQVSRNAAVDCGWGRIVFAHTFDDESELIQELLEETKGQRDIAMYVKDPHVLISRSPHKLFLDPSHTYRLWFDRYIPSRQQPKGFSVRLLNSIEDAEALQTLYLTHGMLPPSKSFVAESIGSRVVQHFVAFDDETDQVLGGAVGIDHKRAFGDVELGSSLWTLAIDPRATLPGIGEAIVRQMIEFYLARGRLHLDLSVMHDNLGAIRLYEKLAFVRVPVFAIKLKNQINEELYVGQQPDSGLNIYAAIIVREARRRGIDVKVLNADAGYFSLNYGGRAVVCRESLSELTSAIAMSRCDDKAITHQVLTDAGLRVPRQIQADSFQAALDFLAQTGSLVVKPNRGEQGNGVSVDVSDPDALKNAIEEAKRYDDDVILEQYIVGKELRIVVIDYEVVAASLRVPPLVVGNGRDTIHSLIGKASRRRAAATDGESSIPIDEETRRCIKIGGYLISDVLPAGEELVVRKTANLHTGGTMIDVTDELHSQLKSAAIEASKALEIPVTGLDMIVTSAQESEYVIIEANERPGLANHEPRPTAERFIDLLFPNSINTEKNND